MVVHTATKILRSLSRLVMGSRLADTNFYACFSRGRIRLHAGVIVNRIAKTLLAIHFYEKPAVRQC